MTGSWDWAGGVLARMVEEARGPRLWGNCSGRGREWVRSNRPHLLQSWRGRDLNKRGLSWKCRQEKKGREKKRKETDDFSWTEIGSAPGGRVGCAAVEAPPAHTLGELCGGVVGVDDVGGGLAREGIGEGVGGVAAVRDPGRLVGVGVGHGSGMEDERMVRGGEGSLVVGRGRMVVVVVVRMRRVGVVAVVVGIEVGLLLGRIGRGVLGLVGRWWAG